MAGTPLLHLLLFSSAIFLVVAQTDFLSIDCGAAKAYVDADIGIRWVPDGSYIDSGLSANVVDQSVFQPLRTVRYFPNSSASNCYVLPINSGQKYFFRAMFYYGNYDSKNSWPSFYLSFAGNEWTYEEGGSDLQVEDVYYEELIFPARQTTSINLCFTTADWINSVPFISSLELRPLPANYYAQKTVFADAYLHTLYRNYFNQEDYDVVRYDQDKIDRLWIATATVPDYANRINFTTTINTTGMWNMPPPEVLAAALEGKPGYNFNYSVNLGEINSSLLFYFYFWELRSDRNATDVREFNMFVSSDSGERTDPLKISVGPNGTGNWAAAFWGNFGTTKSVSFSLIPTSNSTLQPILNAYEIFAYNEPLVALPLPSPPPPSPSHPPPPPSPSHPPPQPRPGSGSGSGSALRSNTLFLAIVFVLSFYIMLF